LEKSETLRCFSTLELGSHPEYNDLPFSPHKNQIVPRSFVFSVEIESLLAVYFSISMGKRRTPYTGRLTRLFPGHPCRDYIRHRNAIESIFASIFPSWPPISCRTIKQATGIPNQRGHAWKRQWDADPD
jgi:hypothetical protein